jgi:hypothetical protein
MSVRLDSLDEGTRFKVTGTTLEGTLKRVWGGCCRVWLGSMRRVEVHIPEVGSKPARDFTAIDYGTGTEFSRGTLVQVIEGGE